MRTILVLLLLMVMKVDASTPPLSQTKPLPTGIKIQRLWLGPIGAKYAPLIQAATAKDKPDINWSDYLRDCSTDDVFGTWTGPNAYGTTPITFVNYEKIYKSGRDYLAILELQGQVWGVSIIDKANRSSVSTNVETPVSKFLVDIDITKYLPPCDEEPHTQIIAATVNNKPSSTYGSDVNVIYLKFTRLA